MSTASISPLRRALGKSICVISPVITALEPNPRRVTNIFICSEVVFCASSRITNESFRVRPRMKAMGAISMMFFSRIAVDPLRVQHVIERVVERTQIGIDFFLQSAGKKSQTLAGFDRGTRQNDAVDLLVEQGRNRHGDREIRFAGAGRADAEHHVVIFDGFEIAALVGTLRLDRSAAKRALASGFGEPAERGIRVAHHHAQHAAQVTVLKLVARFPQVLVINEQLLGPSYVAGRALEFNAVRAEVDINVQAIFEHVEIFVARPNRVSILGLSSIFFFIQERVAASSSRTGLTVRCGFPECG